MTSFQAAPGLTNRHFQTLYATFFRKLAQPKIEIQRFELADGDFVDCHWHAKPSTNSRTPIAVLFHGLTGSYQSSYIKGIMLSLQKAGIASVLMHFRGCSHEINRTARAYHSGDTCDAKAWIAALAQQFPNSKLFAIGYSLGGNMLLKLLAEYRNNSPLCAAVAVSAPLQLQVSAATMQRGFARVYQQHLLGLLKKSLLHKYQYHDYQALIGLSLQQAKRISSIKQFDDLYTARIHGFADAKDYYQRCSAKQYLNHIQTNTLIIQALDDPFMTSAVLPVAEQFPATVKLEVQQHGGHLGFISGKLWRPQYWLEPRIIDYFSSCQ
ncbi:MAG: hydrolase, alpha/beta fold family [Osedax symbiont Rs2]|nr:MAG: hydrolase, alpha/beta fold family [Osedax symbiont Rs2]